MSSVQLSDRSFILSDVIRRFGAATLLFNYIPLVGLLFSFTNTIGAAMWAAQLEAQANIIDAPRSSNKEAPGQSGQAQ